MTFNEEILTNPWDLIEEIADDETKEYFELDDILIDISLKIINYRINNNLTQQQLAEKLGISQAMVSKLESGDYNPTIEQLWKISKKLGWNFKIILGEETETQIWNINDELTFASETYNSETLEKLGEIA